MLFWPYPAKVSFSGIISHLPKDICFSRLEYLSYTFTQPSFGQKNRVEASFATSTATVSSGLGFFEVSFDALTKSPGENRQSN